MSESKATTERDKFMRALQLISYHDVGTRTTLKQIAFRALDGEDFTDKAIEAIALADRRRTE